MNTSPAHSAYSAQPLSYLHALFTQLKCDSIPLCFLERATAENLEWNLSTGDRDRRDSKAAGVPEWAWISQNEISGHLNQDHFSLGPAHVTRSNSKPQLTEGQITAAETLCIFAHVWPDPYIEIGWEEVCSLLWPLIDNYCLPLIRRTSDKFIEELMKKPYSARGNVTRFLTQLLNTLPLWYPSEELRNDMHRIANLAAFRTSVQYLHPDPMNIGNILRFLCCTSSDEKVSATAQTAIQLIDKSFVKLRPLSVQSMAVVLVRATSSNVENEIASLTTNWEQASILGFACSSKGKSSSALTLLREGLRLWFDQITPDGTDPDFAEIFAHEWPFPGAIMARVFAEFVILCSQSLPRLTKADLSLITALSNAFVSAAKDGLEHQRLRLALADFHIKRGSKDRAIHLFEAVMDNLADSPDVSEYKTAKERLEKITTGTDDLPIEVPHPPTQIPSRELLYEAITSMESATDPLDSFRDNEPTVKEPESFWRTVDAIHPTWRGGKAKHRNEAFQTLFDFMNDTNNLVNSQALTRVTGMVIPEDKGPRTMKLLEETSTGKIVKQIFKSHIFKSRDPPPSSIAFHGANYSILGEVTLTLRGRNERRISSAIWFPDRDFSTACLIVEGLPCDMVISHRTIKKCGIGEHRLLGNPIPLDDNTEFPWSGERGLSGDFMLYAKVLMTCPNAVIDVRRMRRISRYVASQREVEGISEPYEPRFHERRFFASRLMTTRHFNDVI